MPQKSQILMTKCKNGSFNDNFKTSLDFYKGVTKGNRNLPLKEQNNIQSHNQKRLGLASRHKLIRNKLLPSSQMRNGFSEQPSLENNFNLHKNQMINMV